MSNTDKNAHCILSVLYLLTLKLVKCRHCLFFGGGTFTVLLRANNNSFWGNKVLYIGKTFPNSFEILLHPDLQNEHRSN